MLPSKYVITIGRSFGSGGRALGRMIAERLGIAFYDKMLLVKAAEKAGYNIEYFEQGDERIISDIELLQELSYGIRHGSIKIIRQTGGGGALFGLQPYRKGRGWLFAGGDGGGR